MRVVAHVLVAFCGISASVLAAEPWDAPPFTGDPKAIALAAARLAVPENADGDVFLHEQEIRLERDGRRTIVDHLVGRPLGEGAVARYASVEALWRPWNMERPELRARSISATGEVRELDPATISEGPARPDSPAVYSDARLLRAPIPGASRGTVIETLITTRETAPLVAGAGTAGHAWLGSRSPTRIARISVEAEEKVPLRIQILGTAAALVESTSHGRRRFEAELRDVGGFEEETDLPPDVFPAPLVRYSTARSWNEVAAAYASIVNAQIARADLRGLAEELKLRSLPREEAVRRAFVEVRRRVRYTAVELGATAIVPRTPEETLGRAFGDCKDLSTLLAALLRAGGIPADLALVAAMAAPPIADLPGFGFDHAIVYVPGEPAIWVDPTVDGDGTLPPLDQDRLVLVASPSTTALRRTPDSAAANFARFTTEVDLAEAAPSPRVRESLDTTGTPDLLRRFIVPSNDEKRDRTVVDSLTKRFQAASGRRISPADEPGRPGSAAWEFDKARTFVTTLARGEAKLPLGDLGMFLPRPLVSDDSKPRRRDVYVMVPVLLERRFLFHLPPHWSAPSLPRPRTIVLGPVSLREELAQEKDTLSATYSLDLRRRRISAAEANEFRDAFRKLQPRTVHFESQVFAALSAGRFRDAVGEARGLVAARPTDATQHVKLAYGLLAAGAGEEARLEARRAVEAQPALALAHMALGWTLEHDALGRLRHPRFDLAGALASYRKAKEIDPQDYFGRLHLAEALEYDADGIHFGSRAQLDAAAAEYESMRKEWKIRELELRHLTVLLRRERFDDVLRLAAEVEESVGRDSVVVAAVGAQAGLTPATDELDRRAPQGQKRREIAEAAARLLVALREYNVAAELYAIAADGAEHPERMNAWAAILRKTRHNDDVRIDPSSPAGAFRQILHVPFAPRYDPQELEALFASAVRKAPDARRDFARLSARLRSLQSSLADLPPAAVEDVAISLLAVEFEGNASEGYRISASATVGTNAVSFTGFFVPEEGKLRLLCFDPCGSLLSEHALALVEAGNLSGAKRFLAWQKARLENPDASEIGVSRAFRALWGVDGPKTLDEARALAALIVWTRETRAADAAAVLARQLDRTAPADRAAVEATIASALATASDSEGALRASESVVRELQGSPAAFRLRTSTLVRLQRWAQLAKEAAERLATTPHDPAALDALAEADTGRGDFAAAEARYQELARTANPARALNNSAWYALARGSVTESDVADARRAVELDKRKQANYLHTLACVEAATGHALEARQALRARIERKSIEEIDDGDWLLAGLVAEADGVPEAALRAYAHIAPEPDAHGVSAAYVARIREKGLHKP